MNTFNKDRLYAENEDLRERIAELEKENSMLEECSNRNDISSFDLLAEASNKIAELEEENSFLKGLRMIAAIPSDEKERLLKKRIAELEKENAELTSLLSDVQDERNELRAEFTELEDTIEKRQLHNAIIEEVTIGGYNMVVSGPVTYIPVKC